MIIGPLFPFILQTLTGELAKRPVKAGTSKVKSAIIGDPRNLALEKVSEKALATVLDSYPFSQEYYNHYDTIYSDFIHRLPVLGELDKLLDSYPEYEIDWELLESEFNKAGYDPYHLEKYGFHKTISLIMESFYYHASREPELQSTIQIGQFNKLVSASNSIARYLENLTQLIAIENNQLPPGHKVDEQPAPIDPLLTYGQYQLVLDACEDYFYSHPIFFAFNTD